MLAILAALSVLGTTGLTVGAEDTATTTEPATEAITTTETEAETTAAETTAETETTVETAAAEENQTVGKVGETAEFTFNGMKFQAVQLDPEDFDSSDPLFQSGCVGLTINRIEEDGSITATNLTKIKLFIKGDGGGSGSDTPVYLKPVLDFISIDGDILTIDAYGGNQSYQYVDGQFVPAGTASTTTTTTAAETITTTTTTTKRDDAHPIDGYYPNGDFQLDGVTLTPKVEYSNKEPGLDEAWLYLNIYSQDGTLLVSVPADTYVADDGRPENYGKVGRYLVKTGSNTITVIDYSGSTVKHHSYVFENGKFVSTGTTTDDNQEKTFTVEIPTSYVKAFCYKRGQEITESNYKDSMVISCTTITGCTNGTVSIVPNGYFVGGFIVENAKPGTITITGTTGTYSSSEDPNVNTSHGQCGAGIGDRLDSFTVTVTIDENGNIVTGGSDNGDSGKTDNGSASNAPATKNTSGTPKTGDMTTVPAVAVGLTLTAAGVVAFISKRKK
ncbi:MAG: LPXTG cell wall anchor domain-containing protein [Ruminococcus sp.]